MALQCFTIILLSFTIILLSFTIILLSFTITLQCFTTTLGGFTTALQCFTTTLGGFTIALQSFTITLQSFTTALQGFTITLQGFYNVSRGFYNPPIVFYNEPMGFYNHLTGFYNTCLYCKYTPTGVLQQFYNTSTYSFTTPYKFITMPTRVLQSPMSFLQLPRGFTMPWALFDHENGGYLGNCNTTVEAKGGYGILHPYQFGGTRQHSTIDAASMLTNHIRLGWKARMVTSVLAFDVAQFFPSVQHDLLLRTLERYGFSAKYIRFLASYFTGRTSSFHQQKCIFTLMRRAVSR